jgi:predicted dienelactone hydrolase
MPRTSSTSALVALLISSTAAFADPAGYMVMSFDVPHHDTPIDGAVWYPTTSDTPAKTVNENGVFLGVDVKPDAAPKAGAHPVILLSHGLGGNYRSMTWLGAGLAERGAVVVVVNHPASSTWSFDMREGLNHWTRAQDLSATLDDLLVDPRFATAVDPAKIMAAGFSYGGWTALSLGGLTGSLAGSIAHCEDAGTKSSHCADLAREGVSFADLDPALWNASYKDPRVSMVAAIDPALHYGLDASHIAGLVDNVQMFALGEGADRLLATDYGPTGSGFGVKLPDAALTTLAPASHFMALPLCKPMGEMILKEEKDDPVCTDPEGADRAAVHTAIIDGIAAQLGL